MTKKFLIIGGAGFIGAQVTKVFQMAGHETVVLDDLSRGLRKRVLAGDFVLGDFGDAELLDLLFKKNTFSGVLHFAALLDVGESVSHPDLYYQHNIVKTLTLLNAMKKHHVNHLVFSSSAAVYGIPDHNPITEEQAPKPINPYGRTKWMVEQILADYHHAFGLDSCCLRYFNAAGGDPDNLIPYCKRKENNLIPIILNNIQDKRQTTVFGNDYPTPDGTCGRDYIHIDDLATAHLKAMDKLIEGKAGGCYNLGIGKAFSVLDVITTIEKVTGQKVDYTIGARRQGDPAFLIASGKKAEKELDWRPQYCDLETIVQHSWNVMKGAV